MPGNDLGLDGNAVAGEFYYPDGTVGLFGGIMDGQRMDYSWVGQNNSGRGYLVASADGRWMEGVWTTRDGATGGMQIYR